VSTIVTLEALQPEAPETRMLLDRTQAHLRWGAPLELRDGRCEIVLVGSDGAIYEPSRRVEAALIAAADEIGVEWVTYFALGVR
jgi:hypothetical protein